MKIIYSNNNDSFVLSEEEKPCFICKKPTKQIEKHFEYRICLWKKMSSFNKM